jgi:V8-like Glu-specific endopeptidase
VQGQFGFMAFIEYFDSTGKPVFLCSGTLVSSNVVLTAGHCAVDESSGVTRAASGYRVVTGVVDWTDAAQRTVSAVSRVVVNPGFAVSGGVPINDAALLILSSPVRQSPIALWGTGQVEAGERATIAGWGETFAGQPAPQTLLQWAHTVLQSPSYCQQFNPAFQPSRQLCVVNAPSYDTATCNGDSGGPLLATDADKQLLEIGITSVGPANCNTTTADYFTAVLPIEPWVGSEVKAVAPTPRIPTLTFADARHHIRQTLNGVLGSAFRHRQRYRTSCTRDSAVKIGCSMSFTAGRSYYYGAVTIRYVLVSGQVKWTDRYVIHRVNHHCYFRSGHRSSCRTHTLSGSW